MPAETAPASRRVEAGALAAWASRCLQAVGVSERDAEIVANALVQTSLWGIDSHGVARLTHYLERIRAGSVEPRPQFAIRDTGPCTATMDAAHGLGILACFVAMDHAMGLARSNGVGIVGIGESTHCGAIGLYTRRAADAGLIGMAFTHANSIVAPHGGTGKFLGTNPLSIAVPQAEAAPVCLDMATSSIPWNRVVNARRENHDLPDGVVIDASGRSTTDPHTAAALRPLGGTDFGHKGYALALMIDLLCGPLNAMPAADHITPMYGDLAARRHLGSLVMAIDPMRFAGGPTLAASVRELIARALQQPGEVQYPGQPEERHAAERGAHGIPIEPGLWAEFLAWSDRLGISAPPIR
jgi:ureidoglycolate dehydrogenase (NAD+)